MFSSTSSPFSRQNDWPKLILLPIFKQILVMLWLAAYLILLLSLISYDPADLAFNVYPPNPVPSNFIGWVGASLASYLYAGFGFGAYIFPLLCFWFGLATFLDMPIKWRWKPLWAALFILSATALLDLQHFGGWALIQKQANFDSPGGLLGQTLIWLTVPSALNTTGAAILFGLIYAIALILLFDLNPIRTVLGASAWYRDYIERRELDRMTKASPEERLEIEQRRLRRQEEELRKKVSDAPLAEVSAAFKSSSAPDPKPMKISIRRLEDDEEDAVPKTPATKVELPRTSRPKVGPDEGDILPLRPLIEPEPASAKIENKAIRVAGAPRKPTSPEPEPLAHTPASDLLETSSLPIIAKPTPKIPLRTPSREDVHPDYVLPPVETLAAPEGKARAAGLDEEQLAQNLSLIIETLRLFGVAAVPGDITPGATITRYEVYPAAGVRVDKISSLGKDLSRVLCAERINILAPIPGKDSVGIEVPNSNKVGVFLRELLESKDWQTTTAKIPIALGKDVYGKTLVADLAAMPHLLIGGTTGSGKSVCINCILMSFLYKFSPDDLRLILIDPKQVEMQVYNDIPHLVVPVVTDPKKVMLALRWVINEMEKRYRILAKVGVRNIASFNSRPKVEAKAQPSPQLELNVAPAGGLDLTSDPNDDNDDSDEDDDKSVASAPNPNASNIRVPREDDLVIPDKMPYIVVIIDELADLMQTAPADVESAIARLTAKARAAGIHLIVATQTPRREVITGVIKTNIPARIAFQVPSGLDSRVILDENGAENLLGKGDLLYRPPGVGRLVRGQGAFVSDDEVQDVVKHSGDQAEATFAPDIHAKLSGKGNGENISEEDQKLIYECLEVIRQEKRASTSNLQRRLRLGYNRAAYVIDYLERIGVLGPGEGAKPREILVDLEDYHLEF